MVQSARGMQQGCSLSSLCYGAGALKYQPPQPGTSVVLFIDALRGCLVCSECSVHRMATRAAEVRGHLTSLEEVVGDACEWIPT